jgi:hypothetical protein
MADADQHQHQRPTSQRKMQGVRNSQYLRSCDGRIIYLEKRLTLQLRPDGKKTVDLSKVPTPLLSESRVIFS